MKENYKIYQFPFEKLRVWQKTKEFVLEAYQITAKFPTHEKFGLVDQIRRAAVSVPANIAEGSSRLSSKDQAHFTNMAYSSLMEVLSHFYLAMDLKYINEEMMDDLKFRTLEISNQVNALRKSQIKNK